MFIPLKVKICGLTREEDVDRALAAGADYCGFIVYPGSKRALSWVRACELAERVPRGKRVLVDVETGTDVLANRVRGPFDYFQIHCSLDIGWGTLAGWSGLAGKDRLWLAPRVPPESAFSNDVLEFADTVLMDTYSATGHGGTGKTGDWAKFAELKNLHLHKQWILAGGLTPENVVAASHETGAETIDVGSGVEASPGVKDPAKLEALFAALNEQR